jgi:spermidine synthase
MIAPLIYTTHDSRGSIEVRQDKAATVRTLHFGNRIEQSRYYLHAPFTLGFEYLQVAFDRLMAQTPETLLTLGLGGGRLNTQIHYALPHCQQKVVELREAVIEVAYDFFDLPVAANLAVHLGDAFQFVQQDNQQYDAIFVDLFDSYGMPTIFATDAFLQALLLRLNHKGCILINAWRDDDAVTNLLLPWLRRHPGLTITQYKIQSSPNWIIEVQTASWHY